MGAKEKNLDAAIDYINLEAGHIIKYSSRVETAPWGNTEQDSFINQAILIETRTNPEPLLQTLLDIETKIGRERREKWGPRKIDIDILYYEQWIVKQENITIPHPYMQDRRFTLVPLQEISPHWVHPVLLKTVTQMLEECKDEGEVTFLK